MADTIRLVAQAQRERAKICGYCEREFLKDTRNTWKYWARAKFCSAECFGAHHAVTAAANRKSMAEVFSKWSDKSDGCWIWKGATDQSGYGIFTYAGKNYRASRIALELDGRAPINGQYACHHCDNPPCVNPAHLYPGTHRQNEADKVSRGRQVKGAAHYAAKLNDEAVRHIRASRVSAPKLAAQYGVSRSSITMVRTYRTWRHVA